MRIQDWGEDGFIGYLKTQFPSSSSRNSSVGIGDDCAVIPGNNGISLLVTTDALVEGIHFIRDQISPEDLGYKTIAVNVSDIAAMGGAPEYAFLSIALPPSVECDWLKGVVQGIKEACMKWNLQLLGGDTVGSKRDVFLNLTLTGSICHDRIKYRHHAKAGDFICVNGCLGDSEGGLKALQEGLFKTEDIRYLIQRHFRPKPNPQEGIWLATHEGVHAMMDVSDGLDCDVQRLIKSSGCGAVIETSKLPISNQLSHVSSEFNWNVFKMALAGGEDYCLLMTISEDVHDSIRHLFQEKFNHPLHVIGRIINHPNQVIYHEHGRPVEIGIQQFDHFR